MSGQFYEVIVSNIGKVYEGFHYGDARATFKIYRASSIMGTGRSSGEDVSLWEDNEPIEEYTGTNNQFN